MAVLRRTFDTMRTAAAIAPARPAYAAGLRAAVATVVPLVLDQMLGGGGGGTWASLGGFNGALADRGGPYRTRAATMAAVAVCCAATVFLGALGGKSLYVAVPLAFVVALVASLARVYGLAGASVGGASLSAFVISLAYPARTANEALVRALLTVAGGLWAMAIALVVWPLQPFRPARVAVAKSYDTLAAYVDDVARHVRETSAGAPSELPAGSALVRASLEEARAVLASLRRGRPGASGREERLVVLGELVDQLFGHAVAVADTVDAIPHDARAAVVDEAVTATLGALASTARSLAAAVLAERDADPVGVEWTGAAVRAALASVADVRPAAVLHYGEAAAILDRAAQYAETARVTAAALNAGRAADGPVPRPVSEDVDEPAPVLATVRAILAPDSLILRYALRVAVVVATAVALTDLLDFKRGYWMTITAIVILQPYTGVTTQRAMQRVAGTVLGGIITAALGALFHDPRAILVLAFVLAATCVALLPLNYAAFSIFLTPTFVLLAEASAGDWHLAGVRVAHTLLGGTLALAGSRLLWPSPEWRRLPGYMAAALSANRNYLRSVIELFDDRSVRAGETIRTARRAIGLATVNAEESFQRLVGELDGPVGELSPALTFLTYTRRLTASIAALALARHTAPVGAGEGTTLAPFAHAATRVLDDLAAAVVAERRPAALPILVTTDGGYAERVASPLVRARLDRLARQIRLLHDAIDRWTTRNDDTRPASAQMQR